MNDSIDLKVLLPEQEIVVGGEILIIKPFTFGKLPKVIKQAGAVINMFTALPVTVFDEFGELRLDDPAVLIILTTHMAEGSDVLIDLMCLGSCKTREWIEELSAEDGIVLMFKIWEINKDFFTRQLLPRLQKFQPAKEKHPKMSDGELSSNN
jgi:hypothetical protein